MSARRLSLALLLVPPLLSGCSSGGKRVARGARAAATAAADPASQTDIGAAAGPALPQSSRLVIDSLPAKVVPMTFTVTDGHIGGPDTVVLGPVEIRLVNQGTVPHEVSLIYLPPVITAADAVGNITRTGLLPSQGVKQGGVGPVGPAGTTSVVELLQFPGTYLVVDELPSTGAGEPWFTKNMLRVLVVTGPSNVLKQTPILRAASQVITTGNLLRFGATLTRGENRSLLIEGRWRFTRIERGDNVIKVDNRTGQGHDLVILKSGDPMAMRDYVDWIHGDRAQPPAGLVGGIPNLYPGLVVARGPLIFYIKAKLAPGTYTIFCPRRPGNGDSHYELGEMDQFYVY